MYILGNQAPETPISLKLCYVDENEIVELTKDFNQVKTDLFEVWKLVDRPYQVNPDSCKYCSFGNICQL